MFPCPTRGEGDLEAKRKMPQDPLSPGGREMERGGITQVVDGNWGVHAIVKKALFAGRSDF